MILWELINGLVFGIENVFPGGSLVLPLAFLFLGARDLVLKLVAYRRKEKTTKQVMLPLGLTFLILGALVLAMKSFMAYHNQEPRPRSSVQQHEGFFPLYEKDCSKTISIDQHPNVLRFFIYIETQFLSDPKLDDVVLSLEAIKDGEVIGSQIIQGTSFYNMGKSGLSFNHLYAIAHVYAKQINGTPKSYFKARNPCTYRLKVVQPCEKYEYVISELRTSRCY